MSKRELFALYLKELRGGFIELYYYIFTVPNRAYDRMSPVPRFLLFLAIIVSIAFIPHPGMKIFMLVGLIAFRHQAFLNIIKF